MSAPTSTVFLHTRQNLAVGLPRLVLLLECLWQRVPFFILPGQEETPQDFKGGSSRDGGP